MTLKLGMQHRVLEYNQVCSNDDPGLTLTYFTARSNLVPYASVWENGFFQRLLSSDLKLLQQMTEVTRSFCWHQNFVPWGLYAPCPGLYTCIKSWKKMYKIRLQRDFFETCNRLVKWYRLSVDIKIMSPGGCIHVLNHEKKIYKIRLQRHVLKLLQQMNEVTRHFCWHQNFVPWGLSAPAPGLYTCIKSCQTL